MQYKIIKVMKTEKQLIKEIIKIIDGCIDSHIGTVMHHTTYNYHNPKYAKDAQKDVDNAKNWKENFAETLTETDIKHFREVFLNDEVILMAIVVTKCFDKDKKVDIAFIKKNFQTNIAKILKPAFLD